MYILVDDMPKDYNLQDSIDMQDQQLKVGIKKLDKRKEQLLQIIYNYDTNNS